MQYVFKQRPAPSIRHVSYFMRDRTIHPRPTFSYRRLLPRQLRDSETRSRNAPQVFQFTRYLPTHAPSLKLGLVFLTHAPMWQHQNSRYTSRAKILPLYSSFPTPMLISADVKHTAAVIHGRTNTQSYTVSRPYVPTHNDRDLKGRIAYTAFGKVPRDGLSWSI